MSLPSNIVKVLDPTIPVDQSIYEPSSDQKAKLGTRLRVGERTYHYAQLSTSANVNPGDVVCAPQLIASHQSGIMTCGAATTGATTISITGGTAVSANQYAEGYIVFASQALAGGGISYKIKANSAALTAAAGTVTLYDPIPGSVGAGPINLVPSEYSSVKVGSQALDRAVGVAPVAVTTGQYFWVQTWGPASPKHVAATPANAQVVLGTTGGVVCTMDATTGGGLGAVALPVGKNSNLAATAGQCNPAYLMIAP
jgi:hypothetical protein